MQRRVAGPLVVLLAAACGGQAFTSAANEGSADSGSIDSGIADSAVEGAAGDAAHPPDDAGPDAMASEAGPSDGGVSHGEAGPGDAATCVRTCPAGFDCLAGKCQDDVQLHFTPTSNPGPLSNWQYGYEAAFGSSFALYPSSWKVATMGSTTLALWSVTTNDFEPSAFQNRTLQPVTADGMVLPALAFGLYPGPSSETSVARWVAPETGSYAIDVTFSGISYVGTKPSTVATVGVSVCPAPCKGIIIGQGSMTESLNQFTNGNVFTYSAQAQKMSGLDVVDFYAYQVVASDDPAGGVAVDATITAQ